jgi:dipeptide/tripeptide permease
MTPWFSATAVAPTLILPIVAAAVGWRWAMAALAAGPAVGIWAMVALRDRPEAARLAGGRR